MDKEDSGNGKEFAYGEEIATSEPKELNTGVAFVPTGMKQCQICTVVQDASNAFCEVCQTDF